MVSLKRDDFVEYKTTTGHRILAIIRRCHRDGSYTVESRFSLNKVGKPERGYLGYTFRILSSDVAAASSRP